MCLQSSKQVSVKRINFQNNRSKKTIKRNCECIHLLHSVAVLLVSAEQQRGTFCVHLEECENFSEQHVQCPEKEVATSEDDTERKSVSNLASLLCQFHMFPLIFLFSGELKGDYPTDSCFATIARKLQCERRIFRILTKRRIFVCTRKSTPSRVEVPKHIVRFPGISFDSRELGLLLGMKSTEKKLIN